MNLKAPKTLIMLVALTTLLSMSVFMLTSCALTDPCPHAAQVKANPHSSDPSKSCCAAKIEAKTCPEMKEANPHSSDPSKSCCAAKKEAKTCPEKKESNSCSGDK